MSEDENGTSHCVVESPTPMFKNLKSMFRLAEIGRSRTSVINPLQWTLAILLMSLVVSTAVSAPAWMLIFLASATGAILIVLIVAYVYFMLKNPKELRSERYSLAQTALDKHLLGDSLTGLIDVVDNVLEAPESRGLKDSTSADIEHSHE